jgi:predicted metal-dependent peptidase
VQRLVFQLRQPELPWEDLLREFVVSTIGDRLVWVPPSRRYLHRGLYLPSRREQTLRLTVALDTSASTRGVQPDLLAELAAIALSYGRYELTLIQADAEVRRVRTYSEQNPLDLEQLELKGFGTTDFTAVFTYLAAQPSAPTALVFLTDGRGRVRCGPPAYPVLWVLTDRDRPPVQWGQALHLRRPGSPSAWRLAGKDA